MNTIKVYWKGKFAGRSVAINATDFDPAIHRAEADGDWPTARKAQPEPVEPSPVQDETPTEAEAEAPTPKTRTRKR